jgi:hypothetical protein
VAASVSPVAGGRRRGAGGQLEPEGAALAGYAVHSALAVHGFHQFFGQRQADAGALDTLLVRAQPLEGLEQAGQRVGGDAEDDLAVDVENRPPPDLQPAPLALANDVHVFDRGPLSSQGADDRHPLRRIQLVRVRPVGAVGRRQLGRAGLGCDAAPQKLLRALVGVAGLVVRAEHENTQRQVADPLMELMPVAQASRFGIRPGR